MHGKKIDDRKNTLPLRAFLMTMWIRRYDAKHIAHDGRSRATLDAIGRRHWASIHPVSPWQTPW
jgi:hypothetical protein